MGRHSYPAQRWLAAFAAGFVACAIPQAFAGDASYCVTCKNPDQTYVCRVPGEDAPPSDALKLFCVIRTPKEGNHAPCSAEPRDPGCQAVEKVYAYDGPSIPADIVSDPRVEQFADRVQQEEREFEKPKGAPQTLVELTGGCSMRRATGSAPPTTFRSSPI